MAFDETDPRHCAIRKAAWTAFSTYGFRKTSMDDIAKGAGMSRPAVYLHFKNKEAILKALIDAYYSDTSQAVRAALDTEGGLETRIRAAFEAQGGAAMEAMLNTPHGMETLEASMSTASENIQAGEGLMRDVYAEWLARMAKAGCVTLPGTAEDVARTFCSAMKGVKHTASDYAAYRTGVLLLAQVFAAGLSPR
ncbi:TetR/AcrR family transcriptional regulator [Phaeobacter sp.]|uniref:TetR/AcrR family transcriptional regulator n=1 Tax=Phaeobacter sp. TaxID=1902409 RepID=UPI0025E46CB9|nr:TetR/AcrR family transcriptional regulator [Phaeobacter sp.]